MPQVHCPDFLSAVTYTKLWSTFEGPRVVTREAASAGDMEIKWTLSATTTGDADSKKANASDKGQTTSERERGFGFGRRERFTSNGEKYFIRSESDLKA